MCVCVDGPVKGRGAMMIQESDINVENISCFLFKVIQGEFECSFVSVCTIILSC